jgi:hypothetical protein
LSVYLERACRELGLHPGLRITVGCGQPDGLRPEFLARAIPRQSPAPEAAQITAAQPTPAQPTPAQPTAAQPRAAQPEAADARPDSSAANVAIAAGTGPLAGFSLKAVANVTVACGWNAVEPGHRHNQPPAGLAPMYARLRGELAEPPATLAARLQAISGCLTMAGLQAGEPLFCQRTTSDGWALLETAGVSVASTIVNVSGVGSPVAIALLTGRSPAGASARARAGARASASPAPARAGSAVSDSPAPARTTFQDSDSQAAAPAAT